MPAAAIRFFKVWGRLYFWLVVLPTVLMYVLGAIPKGQMLALVPAYWVLLPGALLFGPIIGAPHFSPEFYLPATNVGFALSFLVWGLIAGTVAFVKILRFKEGAGEP